MRYQGVTTADQCTIAINIPSIIKMSIFNMLRQMEHILATSEAVRCFEIIRLKSRQRGEESDF